MNGQSHDPMALGVLLGGLQAESRRQTEIMLTQAGEVRGLRDEVRGLPDRLADRIPACRARTTRCEISAMGWLRVAMAMGILSAAVFGKITWPETVTVMRVIGGL